MRGWQSSLDILYPRRKNRPGWGPDSIVFLFQDRPFTRFTAVYERAFGKSDFLLEERVRLVGIIGVRAVKVVFDEQMVFDLVEPAETGARSTAVEAFLFIEPAKTGDRSLAVEPLDEATEAAGFNGAFRAGVRMPDFVEPLDIKLEPDAIRPILFCLKRIEVVEAVCNRSLERKEGKSYVMCRAL